VVEETRAPASVEERAFLGARARREVPLDSLADLHTDGRADPVAILAAEVPGRLPELVPLRHERMLSSAFAFFRGGAALMAADLVRTPTSGLTAQLCGDAHVSNFGMFASPERRLVFDVNDFDETFPGPWEWDLKRLAASLAIAGRQNGFSTKETRRVVRASAQRYQQAMTDFAAMGNLEVWYSLAEVAEVRRRLRSELDHAMTKRLDRTVRKAKRQDHLRSLGKLTEVVDGHRRFRADPPGLVPLTDLAPGVPREELFGEVGSLIEDYSGRLAPGARLLVRSYRVVDMARMVVGVGSVGTRCWVVLLLGRDEEDPLLLQVKEAQPSALAEHLEVAHPGTGEPRDEGARVVEGQRISQAAGDVFLGSQRAVGLDGATRYFYLRQLRDWKGSLPVEAMTSRGMHLYGQLCAWTLARAHARSGDRIAIAAYAGGGDAFARAVTSFAEAYAELNEEDFARFGAAVARDPMLGHPAGP
jgi:uncharacterized protein (DUF2252 family)